MFSGYPEAVAVPGQKEVTTAKALIKIFCRFGWPKVILSDNAGSFKNKVMSAICKLTGVTQKFTIIRHPSFNGAAERVVGTIKRALDVLTVKHTTGWEEMLDFVLMAIAQSPRASP